MLSKKLLSQLEEKIGYTFKNKELLIRALTHSSFANEANAQHDVETKVHSYERLEFFGDSILSFIVSEYICANFKDCPEGELTKLRAAVVCEESLYEIAKRLDLGKYILLGKGEENTGGRERRSVLADVVEAIIAAMYKDGGLTYCSDFILNNLREKICSIMYTEKVEDYKSKLQHLVQQAPGELLEYELIEEMGPDHDKTFVMVAKLNRNIIGKGKGRTKREAEQQAAKEALILFGSINGK
jgi:ribonuclease-3